jgi:molybdate transport system substrate-binding protein
MAGAIEHKEQAMTRDGNPADNLLRSPLMKRALVIGCCSLAMFTSTSPSAAELRILTAGAYKQVAVALAPAFEQRTGHKLIIDNGTAGQLAQRINGGEAFDVAVITPAALKELAAGGKLNAESVVNVARVGIGVAVKAGAPAPDISTSAAFQRAVAAARAVAYSDPAAGGSSGIYLAALFEKMGIAGLVRAKAVLVPGGLVAQRLVSGEADLAIHQISEILPVSGVTLVGPLPDDIQNFTVYAAAASAKPTDAKAAADFLALLRSPEALAVLKAKGMEPAPQ